MQIASLTDFISALSGCIKVIKTAARHKINPASHSKYSEIIRTKIALLRKSFIKLQRDFPPERYQSIAFQLSTIDPLIKELIKIYPSPPPQMLKLLEEIKFKTDSDLTAEVEIIDETAKLSPPPPFLPEDLIEDRNYVLKRILWEINRDYDNACYNSCSAMIRRLLESLIIEAYEQHKLHSIIVDSNDDYFGLDRLIGKTINQREFKLTRNTKKTLPNLKFFGDVASHNRNVLIRKSDLDRLHNELRVAIEELSRNI